MSVEENNEIARSLYSKFYEVLFGKQEDNPGTFMSIVDGGYIFSRDDFLFLRDNGLIDHRDKARNFASLVNSVPEGVGRWTKSPDSLNSRYVDWLTNSVVPNVPLTQELKDRLREAEEFTERYSEQYNTWATNYSVAKNLYEFYERKSNRTEEEEITMIRLGTERDIAEREWLRLGKRFMFDEYMNEITNIQSMGYDGIKVKLREKYSKALEKYVDSQGQGFTPVLLYPPSFANPNIRWNKYEFHRYEKEEYKHNSTVNWGGNIGGLYGLFWGSANASGERREEEYTLDTEDLKISFEYTRVSMDRSIWLDTGLLRSRKWWWDGATRENPRYGEEFSNGKRLPEIRGTWQMVPMEAIFTRKLEIRFDKSSERNRTVIQRMNGRASAGFAFWRLKGKYSSTDERELTFETDHEWGVSCPEMQIIGFRCSLMPILPNPDTAMMRSLVPFNRERLFNPKLFVSN